MAAANRVHVPEDSAASKVEGSETSKEEADMAATKALDSEASKVEGSAAAAAPAANRAEEATAMEDLQDRDVSLFIR